jgi:hypothetical protein
MKERIVIKDTADPRCKQFALTRPLPNYSGVTSLQRAGNKFQNSNGNVFDASGLGPISGGVFCLRAILKLAVLNEFEITLTVGPAFLWTDIDDDMPVLDRAVEIIKDRHFHNVPEVEVVNESSLHCFG